MGRKAPPFCLLLSPVSLLLDLLLGLLIGQALIVFVYVCVCVCIYLYVHPVSRTNAMSAGTHTEKPELRQSERSPRICKSGAGGRRGGKSRKT